MKKNKISDTEYKTYSTTKEEKANIRRILSTVGFFDEVIKGLNYSLQIEQGKIEKRCGIGKAKEGYTIQTKLDPETLDLFVREIKDEEKNN